MKITSILCAALAAFTVGFWNVVPSFAQPPVGNLVGAELTRGHWYFTNQDSIDNLPVQWSDWVFADIFKWPDGGSPVLNPGIQLSTKLGLTGFQPTSNQDPAITFTADKDLGLYTWRLAGQVNENAHMSVSAVEGTSTAAPRFSASRSVQPEILLGSSTFQTVTVSFKLEEALPQDAFNLSVVIGLPNFAYKTYQLVSTRFVSQIDVAGWASSHGPTIASWSIDPSMLQLGKTYAFQATLESVKSEKLLGAPIYKPQASVFYSDQKNFGWVNGTSIEIADPTGVVGARFTADNVVNWTGYSRKSRWNVILNSAVSPIDGSQPPFRVFVPAEVRIEPEVLHLGSKGVVTAFVQLPKPYRVQDIDVSSVTLRHAHAVGGTVAGDALILKFDRDQWPRLMPGQQVDLRMEGYLADGSIFRGKDSVRVLP